MSLIKRSYKYRMYPNKTQEELLAFYSGVSVLYGTLALIHSIHITKKQILIRNFQQKQILLLTNRG